MDQPQEVVTGNPTVIKMLVSFYRHARGQNALREILGPVVREILQDRTLSIRVDPVEIYKSWINQTESQTGHKRSVNSHELHFRNNICSHYVVLISHVLVELIFESFVRQCCVCLVCLQLTAI